jgi:outer membrane protein OmpA-like peptidoglycan-associated protein
MWQFIITVVLSCTQAHANVVGADTQNFNPTNDGLDFVTVQSSKTLQPGLFNLGLFLNYAVNSLPNYENVQTQSRTNFQDALLSSDLNFAVGLLRNWEVGVSMPAVLSQQVQSDVTTYSGQYVSTGITEFRGMTKLRLLGDHRRGIAVIGSMNFNQIANDPFAGSGAGPTYNLEVAADTALADGFQLAGNFGYRWRNPGQPIAGVPIQPLGNQYIASGALSYLITSIDTKIIGEVFGSWPQQHQIYVSDRSDSTAEALLGLKTDITPSLAFHVGGGTEIVHGTSSPDWRVYTGLNWVMGPLFSKPKRDIVRVQDDELPALAMSEVDREDPYSFKPGTTESFVARDLLFEFNSHHLRPESENKLMDLVEYLKTSGGFRQLVIIGHTDSIGNAQYNVDLSKRRAGEVRATMIALGLPAAKVKAYGVGAARPIANNGNFQGRALNRRVEFQIQR